MLTVGLAEAAFIDQFSGARALGRSGAISAVANRADGVMVNPATLINIQSRQLTATTARLHAGLQDQSQLSQHLLGFGYNVEGQAQKQTTVQECLGILLKRFSATTANRLLYSENYLVISGARDFRWEQKETAQKGAGDKHLALGLSVKILNWDTAPTIGANETIIEDLAGRTQLSFDVGGLFFPSPNVPIALSVQNLNRPNIASHRTANENLDSASRPSYLTRILTLGIGVVGQRTIWDMDLVFRPKEVDVRVGLEYQAKDQKTAIRGGFRLENLAWGTNFTLGGSYRPTEQFTLDYAFIYPISGISQTYGSHRFSLVYDY